VKNKTKTLSAQPEIQKARVVVFNFRSPYDNMSASQHLSRFCTHKDKRLRDSVELVKSTEVKTATTCESVLGIVAMLSASS
jgi:hypothetical protein